MVERQQLDRKDREAGQVEEYPVTDLTLQRGCLFNDADAICQKDPVRTSSRRRRAMWAASPRHRVWLSRNYP